MPTVEQQTQVGRAPEHNVANLKATVNQLATGMAEATQRRHTALAERFGELSTALNGRFRDEPTLLRLRRDQDRQLSAVDRVAEKVLDRLRQGVDDLATTQRGEVERCPATPEARGQLARRHRDEVRAVEQLNARALTDLRGLADRQETALREQRLAWLGAAADGSLGTGEAEALARRRDRDLEQTRRQGGALATKVDKWLSDERWARGLGLYEGWEPTPGAEPATRAPAQSRTARNLRTLPAETAAELRTFADRVADRTAELLRGASPDSHVVKPEEMARLRAQFVGACHDRDLPAAGSAFHAVAAKVAVPELASQAPPGWTVRAEAKLGGKSLDLLLDRAGEAYNVDWKPTGRSALSKVDQLAEYERLIEADQQRRFGIRPNELALTQESRSWMDYIKPHQVSAPPVRASTGEHTVAVATGRAQLRGAAVGLAADLVMSKLAASYAEHLEQYARSHPVERDPRSIADYLRDLPAQIRLSDLVRSDYTQLLDRTREDHADLRQRVSEDAIRLIFEESTARGRLTRLADLDAAVAARTAETTRLTESVDRLLAEARPRINDAMAGCTEIRALLDQRLTEEVLFHLGMSVDQMVGIADTLARYHGGLRNARTDLETLARQLHEGVAEQQRLSEQIHRLLERDRAADRRREVVDTP
jgi:hypothetical protein